MVWYGLVWYSTSSGSINEQHQETAKVGSTALRSARRMSELGKRTRWTMQPLLRNAMRRWRQGGEARRSMVVGDGRLQRGES